MRRTVIIGVILIVLGLLGFIYPRISFTEKSTAIDLGPVEIQTEQRRTIPIPEIAAGLAVAAGVVLVVAGSRGRS